MVLTNIKPHCVFFPPNIFCHPSVTDSQQDVELTTNRFSTVTHSVQLFDVFLEQNV